MIMNKKYKFALKGFLLTVISLAAVTSLSSVASAAVNINIENTNNVTATGGSASANQSQSQNQTQNQTQSANTSHSSNSTSTSQSQSQSQAQSQAQSATATGGTAVVNQSTDISVDVKESTHEDEKKDDKKETVNVEHKNETEITRYDGTKVSVNHNDKVQVKTSAKKVSTVKKAMPATGSGTFGLIALAFSALALTAFGVKKYYFVK
jgi:hypothetical protein